MTTLVVEFFKKIEGDDATKCKTYSDSKLETISNARDSDYAFKSI